MKKYFYNYNEVPLCLDNIYQGSSCFLITSGPSLKTLNLSLLNQPGIVTFGVNNSASIVRPKLWVSVDDPANFAISIWKDPSIQKFVMYGKRNKRLWNNVEWKDSELRVSQCPNVVYYKDNEHFKPTEEWLEEETINWGNHGCRCECGFMFKDTKEKHGFVCPECGGRQFGARSVMLAAIKICYLLGFKNVFILGADFKMTEENKYAFDQGRSLSSIKSNTDTYNRLNSRFSKLRPVFEKNDFFVFNSTPNSGLESFIKIDYKEAIDIALKGFPDTKNERTFGMYDRKACDKHVDERTVKLSELAKKISEEKDRHLLRKLNRQHEHMKIKLAEAIEERNVLLTWKA